MNVRWLEAGFCRAPERLTRRDGRWAMRRFPAGFALLESGPRIVLFDTGYAPRVTSAMQANAPRRMLARVLAPVPVPAAAAQIAALGIPPEAVTDVVVSHFHTDHVGGLRDFPRARFHTHPDALAPVRTPRTLDARAGYAAELLPDDFDARLTCFADVVPLPPVLAPFTTGFDVLGDGRLLAFALPGHAPGQCGLYVETPDGPWLLLADATWHADALFDERAAPSRPGLWLQHDPRAYADTQARLRSLLARAPALTLAVSHDAPRRLG